MIGRRHVRSPGDVWADRLGVESPAEIDGELEARLSGLVSVVRGDVPAPGSAECAVLYGDLLELVSFLTDARLLLMGREVVR